MKRLLCTLALATGLLASGCAHAPPEPAAEPLPVPAASGASAALQQRFSGSYLYAGGDAEKKAVAAAVEKAIAGMGFLAKPVARQSLKQRAEIREGYTFVFDSTGHLKLSSKGFPVESGPLDGKPFPFVTREGDATQVSFRFVDGMLLQEGRTEDGSGRTEFRLADDGATLLVHRVMESTQLTAPVEYSLTYRRQ
jgi:hypothetical protein